MRAMHLVAVLAASIGAAVGQQAGQQGQQALVQARVFRTASLARFDEQLIRDEQMGAPVPAVKRLSDLVQRLGGADPKLGPPVFQRGRGARGEVLIAGGTAEQMDVAGRVFDQLQLPAIVQARLQCSLVTMPVPVAREHGLKPGEVVATDEPAAARLVRDAVKRDGTLRNLPEVVTGPLAPFVRATGEKAAAKQTVGKQPSALQLRGEMVPMRDGEIALGVHVVRGKLPHDPTQVPESTLMQPVFRLAAGGSALFMVVDRDVATVLVVRCLEVTNEAPREGAGR